jgi:predicted acyl esterase
VADPGADQAAHDRRPGRAAPRRRIEREQHRLVRETPDVAPDGTENIVAEGQLRASLRALAPGSTPTEPRHPLVNPKPLTPHQFYDFQIALQPTAYTFAAGDKLQIRVTSGDIPNSVPGTVFLDTNNPTTPLFTPLPPTVNTVMLGGRDGTSLLLPMLG